MHPPSFNPNHVISDWPDCCLELGCPAYGKVTIVSLRMFGRDYGRLRVLDLVRRLRCQACRVAAAPVFLCASYHRRHLGRRAEPGLGARAGATAEGVAAQAPRMQS